MLKRAVNCKDYRALVVKVKEKCLEITKKIYENFITKRLIENMGIKCIKFKIDTFLTF